MAEGDARRRYQAIRVLLVEDNIADVELTNAAFEAAGIETRPQVVSDGREALDYLNRRGRFEKAPRPDLVLLDLNLPYVHGLEVLKQAKADEQLRHIPIIVLTMSQSPDDVLKAYQNHAAAYIPKPLDFHEFVDVIQSIADFWMRAVRFPAHSGVRPRTSPPPGLRPGR